MTFESEHTAVAAAAAAECAVHLGHHHGGPVGLRSHDVSNVPGQNELDDLSHESPRAGCPCITIVTHNIARPAPLNEWAAIIPDPTLSPTIIRVITIVNRCRNCLSRQKHFYVDYNAMYLQSRVRRFVLVEA